MDKFINDIERIISSNLIVNDSFSGSERSCGRDEVAVSLLFSLARYKIRQQREAEFRVEISSDQFNKK